MSSQLLDLIENFLGSELSVGLSLEALPACDDLNQEQIKLLSSHIHDWDRRLHETLAEPEQDWDRRFHETLAEPRADSDPLSVDEVKESRPFSAMYTHPYNGLRPLQIDQVKRQLLFFPKVAIVRPDLRYSQELPAARSSVKEFVKSLLELEELLRDGTVEFIPMTGFYSNEIEGGAAIIRRACDEDAEIVRWLMTKSNLIKDFAVTARPGDPYFDAGIRIASALTYGYELVATHPFVGELYAQLVRGQTPPDRERTAIATNLERISLPGLSGLNWREVKAIRDDEESFRRWRADLQDVIATVDPALPPAEFIDRFNAIARARLGRAAIDVERELKESAALTRLRTGAVSFAIGAVAGISTIATFGVPVGATLWTAVLKAVETGGVSAALQFLWASKRSTGKKALRSHYSVFAPK